MAMNIAEWRARIKDRIRQQYPPGRLYDAEAEQQVADILRLPVPSDDELIAMQGRGELPSDDELVRDGSQ